MPTYPFEVTSDEIKQDADRYVEVVFSCLESDFLIMPRGEHFISYPLFEQGYEALKAATVGFSQLDPNIVFSAVVSEPISMIVLRTMLGFTPPEWGYLTIQRTGTSVTQSFVRSLDRRIRMAPDTPLETAGVTGTRVKAMIQTACDLLASGTVTVDSEHLHRLDKADTRLGVEGIKNLARLGVPYAMLLYERFLGRPFAGHRDSVSELIGNSLESAIEDVLDKAGISYRKTKRAERIEGFDQTPDFIVPSEFSPQVVIEAKITQDDGTARDKVTRIQHLNELSRAEEHNGEPRFQVIACIGGRGFGVRREDMRKLLLATRGKVFTAKTLHRLVDCTRLKDFRTQDQ